MSLRQVCDVTWVLLLEKVDAMALAAMASGNEEADVFKARDHLCALMDEPLEIAQQTARTPEERDLREALGLSR